MDFVQLGQQIEAMFKAEEVEFELLDELNEDGGVWGFNIDEDVSGFLRCHYAEIGPREPIVCISLSLGALGDYEREDLLGLLEMNGMLYSMQLTVMPELDEHDIVLLQRSLPAEQFQVADFPRHIQDLVDVMDEYFE